jgi:hypothetical protein
MPGASTTVTSREIHTWRGAHVIHLWRVHTGVVHV